MITDYIKCGLLQNEQIDVFLPLATFQRYNKPMIWAHLLKGVTNVVGLSKDLTTEHTESTEKSL